MVISNEKKTFGLHGLYESISVLSGLGYIIRTFRSVEVWVAISGRNNGWN